MLLTERRLGISGFLFFFLSLLALLLLVLCKFSWLVLTFETSGWIPLSPSLCPCSVTLVFAFLGTFSCHESCMLAGSILLEASYSLYSLFYFTSRRTECLFILRSWSRTSLTALDSGFSGFVPLLIFVKNKYY